MYECMVTVIVPFYNVGNDLYNAVYSIVYQKYPQELIQLILVDDGSTDETSQIARELCLENNNVELVYTKHKGVSHARNMGLKYAKGKYILYLDGDDLLSNETISSLVDFYEQHYYEIDLLTYKLVSYRGNINGERLAEHYRYKYLVKSGVYDLKEYPYITQTTMNIMVKNKFENNVCFRESMSFTEDQAYCLDILSKKMKIGYCQEGEYQYIRHEKSSSNKLMSSLYLFEQCINFWEEEFEKYCDTTVPLYVQAAFLNDLSWKNKANILFPYHYRDEDKFKRSVDRIRILLSRVSSHTIMGHPEILDLHKFFFLRLKNEDRVLVLKNKNSISLVEGAYQICYLEKIDIVCKQIAIKRNRYVFKGYVKSGIIDFCENCSIYRECIENDGSKRVELVKTFIGAESWYHSHTKTNTILSFCDVWNIDSNIKSVKYFVNIEYTMLPTRIVFGENTPFFERRKEKLLIDHGVAVAFDNESFHIRKISRLESDIYYQKEIEYYQLSAPDLAYIRKCVNENRTHSIWLYYDAKNVVWDNGIIQFLHDININDGILRYYITQNDPEIYVKLVGKENRTKILRFGEHQHQIAFLNATKIITAYIEEYNIIPFTQADYGRVSDLVHSDIIYLQHGILHAYAPWKYTYLGNIADRIVISSQYEEKIFLEEFHYPLETLIKTGMPRFDGTINKNKELCNNQVILYAPSWRAYLAYLGEDGNWHGNEERLEKTKFYKCLKSIFESKNLNELLKAKKIKLIIKLHPIFNIYYKKIKSLETKNILLKKENISINSCKLVITDYSSIVFDFVKRKIPIIYLFPDQDEFYSGMNGYYRLTLPLEKGFGPLVDNVDELVKKIDLYLSEKCVEREQYKTKMEDFFQEFKQCRRNLYEIIKLMENNCK